MNKNKPVTSSDVAIRAGVSRSTVSRALNDLDCVTEETRQKILKAAAELGYQINMLGRSLNQQKTDLIGVIVRNIKDPFHTKLLKKLLQKIQENGYLAIVIEISSSNDIQSTIKKFAQFRVSGVIITSGSPPIGISKECIKLNIPVILINRFIANEEKIDVVCSDNYAGIEYGLKKLVNENCRSFHFLNMKHSSYSGKKRKESFIEFFERKNKKEYKYDFLISKSNSYEGGFNSAKEVFENNINIQAIVCSNDTLAHGFIDGAREFLNKEAGVDYSIIGFDDIQESAKRPYQLTTIRQDVEQLALYAMEKLNKRIEDPNLKSSFSYIPVKLVNRSSIKLK